MFVIEEPAMSTYKAAVVQASSVPFDPGASAEKATRLVLEAAAAGARLAVFPEVFLGGYPKGSSFGAPVGLRKPEGRDAFRRYYDGAIDLDGPEVAVLVEAVRTTGLFVVIGCLERDGGTLYCTALFLDGENGLVGKHRKLMPTGSERLIWGFGDGSTMPVFETSLGRIGAVICWENYMPALRLAMYDKQVSIYCAPTADDRDTWASSMQHIALEGRCYVLSACQHITRGAFDADYDCALGDAPDTVLMRGGSLIVSPHGQIVAGPDFSGETILYADIDLDEVTRGKYDFDVVGHYARPDIFRLTVDESKRSAVVRKS
jgi:nitrilase